MTFSLGAWDTCEVSRCMGGRGSSVERDPEAHNGLVFLKDGTWVLSTSCDTDGTFSFRKNVLPKVYHYNIRCRSRGRLHKPQLEDWDHQGGCEG